MFIQGVNLTKQDGEQAMIAEAPVSVQDSGARPFTSRSVYEQDGVKAYMRPHALYIVLPNVSREEDYASLYSAFQRIYDAGYRGVDWTVDVSALNKIPLSLLSVLTSFRQELSEHGQRLVLAGARQEAFPRLFM